MGDSKITQKYNGICMVLKKMRSVILIWGLENEKRFPSDLLVYHMCLTNVFFLIYWTSIDPATVPKPKGFSIFSINFYIAFGSPVGHFKNIFIPHFCPFLVIIDFFTAISFIEIYIENSETARDVKKIQNNLHLVNTCDRPIFWALLDFTKCVLGPH